MFPGSGLRSGLSVSRVPSLNRPVAGLLGDWINGDWILCFRVIDRHGNRLATCRTFHEAGLHRFAVRVPRPEAAVSERCAAGFFQECYARSLRRDLRAETTTHREIQKLRATCANTFRALGEGSALFQPSGVIDEPLSQSIRLGVADLSPPLAAPRLPSRIPPTPSPASILPHRASR